MRPIENAFPSVVELAEEQHHPRHKERHVRGGQDDFRTLLNRGGAEFFHENGGVNFAAIPCLNDSDEGMDTIRQLVLRELQGWI